MNYVIDGLAVIILLFCFLSGWHKGFQLSLLGVVRVILAYGGAFFTGRYLGNWLAEVANRPRIVIIPVLAGFTFILITFIFHVVMTSKRDQLIEKSKDEEFQLPWHSSLGGGSISLAVGVLSMILLLWLGDLFMVGMAGQSLPGMDRSLFGRFARRSVYEGINVVTIREGRESQAAATARVISNPALGMQHLKNIFEAESIKQLVTDEQFGEDLLSGDPERIQQNASLQQLFNDRQTLDEMRTIGLVSDQEKKSELCNQLSRFGRNERIRESMQSLKKKDLLRSDRIALLIRDPDFDTVVGELIK